MKMSKYTLLFKKVVQHFLLKRRNIACTLIIARVIDQGAVPKSHCCEKEEKVDLHMHDQQNADVILCQQYQGCSPFMAHRL